MPLRWVTSCFFVALVACAEPQPTVVRVPPRLAPPPAQPERLDREQVLAVAGAEEPARAIEVLDAHAFAFELTPAALDWFGQQGVDPAVHDYLVKRSRVAWDELRER